MPRAITNIKKAQAELDHIWGLLFDEHVVLNDNLIHFFISQEHEDLYKQGYITSIAETNEKYQVVLTRSSFDSVLNNVLHPQSFQSYRPGFETLGWEDIYPKEMKAASEAAQKKQDREAKKQTKSPIKKLIEAPKIMDEIAPKIMDEINFQHEIIDLYE